MNSSQNNICPYVPTLHFTRVDKDAVIPTKGHPTDIGYDLTAIKQVKMLDCQVFLFDTGIKVCPPPGYYIEIIPRSSLSKTSYVLANSVGIIDPSYRGTLMIALRKVNHAAPNIVLPFRRCQMVLRKAEYFNLCEVERLDNTERGAGGFGSTDV